MGAITQKSEGKDGEEFITVSFQVQRKRMPAFRSALGEIGDKVSDELTKNLPYPKAQALTDAVIAIAAIRKATREYGYSEWYEK